MCEVLILGDPIVMNQDIVGGAALNGREGAQASYDGLLRIRSKNFICEQGKDDGICMRPHGQKLPCGSIGHGWYSYMRMCLIASM